MQTEEVYRARYARLPRGSSMSASERAAAMGLRVYPVRGDGNCLPRAIAVSELGCQERHLELRAQAAQVMR